MSPDLRRRNARDAVACLVLACVITWSLDLPFVLACLRHEAPSEGAMALTGLGAFGPMMGAALVALRRGELRRAFRPRVTEGRPSPLFTLGLALLGLAAAPALQLLATLLDVALGGSPSPWFFPPSRPEHVVALFVFSIAEELGWRGFAQPRLSDHVGPVRAAAIVGPVWGLWHLGMSFTQAGPPRVQTIVLWMLALGLWSVIIAWFFERSGRSLAVAMAVHAGAHLDNVSRDDHGSYRLWALRLLVVLVAAGIARCALQRRATRTPA